MGMSLTYIFSIHLRLNWQITILYRCCEIKWCYLEKWSKGAECTSERFTLNERASTLSVSVIVIEGHRWSSECLVRSEKRSGEWWFCQWSCLTLLWYNHTNCVMTQAIRARARGKVATELFIKRIQRRRKWRQLELPLLRSPSWKATRAFINWYIRWVRRSPRVSSSSQPPVSPHRAA